ADTGQMNQVVMNLCLNARDAMPGGGTLTLEVSNVMIDAATAARNLYANPGDYVRLSVIDTGSGFTEDVRRHIFEPFFTTKPPGKGTGLGLAVVFGVVRQHEGWIDCSSTPGSGSRFDLHLPRCQNAVPAEQPCVKNPAGRPETILLVD